MSEALDRVKLDAAWKEALSSEFTSGYMSNLRSFLVNELRSGKRIHPPMSKMFAAMDLCPLNQVKVVIIGQDPYHGRDQAHGLCFSVNPGIPPPPSLVNILREIDQEFGHENRDADSRQRRGCLEPWAKQGVLLLNSVLTVVEGRAGSN
ncbi:MAG: uracil-DNA glycosylase, partial [Gammaproteobacteria bacterium]|nr:uracil-DNA glycosylase [Gammaproteobacteria bacterium]